MHREKGGFTLIELLLVIAILGVLSGAVVIAINPAKRLGQARDAQRKSDLRMLSNAIEAYTIFNGSYPSTNSNWCGPSGADPEFTTCGDDWVPGLVANGDLKVLPKDPKQGQTSITCAGVANTYLYKSDGTNYKILAYCGVETNNCNPSDPFWDGARKNASNCTWAWQISSPGAVSW